MSSRDFRDQQPTPAGTEEQAVLVAGKRAPTDRLPVQRSLRGQERDVRSFDSAGDYYDSRATIDLPQGPTLLDDRQLARARRKNPRWAQRMKLDTRRLSGAAPESDDYALEVARKQADAGLTVDGISGPKTIEALFGEHWQPEAHAGHGGGRTPRDARRFDGEDPFAMHLLEDPGADADPSVTAGSGRGHRGGGS